MGSSYENVKRWRAEVKMVLAAAFGGSCGICFYNRCLNALEFHHLDPATKETTISGWDFFMSFEKLSTEAEKCVLLCAICHREVHAGVREIPAHIRRFSALEYQVAKSGVERQRKQRRAHTLEAQSKLNTPKRTRKSGRWTGVDVTALRSAGWTWTAIGKKAGVSATAAKKRHTKLGV
jgi:hypothetical protein